MGGMLVLAIYGARAGTDYTDGKDEDDGRDGSSNRSGSSSSSSVGSAGSIGEGRSSRFESDASVSALAEVLESPNVSGEAPASSTARAVEGEPEIAEVVGAVDVAQAAQDESAVEEEGEARF
jgi:hypothetical protein